METLREIVLWIFGVSFFYSCGWELFRWIFVNKRFKEYADGLKTNIPTSEELMQIIRNMNCFLVKQVYYNEQGNVEVQGKYGKHRLNLEDGIIHVIRSKEDSRRNYNYVVEENAILDYIAKEENHTLPMNPFTKYKKAMRLTKLHTASLIGTFGGIFLLVVLYLIPSGNEYIEMVKGGAPSSYPQITYGEAFDDYFSDSDWQYFKSSSDRKVVEFHGKCMYGDKEAKLCFQFIIADDNETFSVEYLDIDGESQNMLTMGIALDSIFSSYEESHGMISSDDAEQNVDLGVDDTILNADHSDENVSDDFTDQTMQEDSLAQDENQYEFDDVDVNNLDYREMYSSFVVEMENEYPGNCTYSLYDINGDGRKDLLLSYGTCNADYENIIYTIDENGAISSTSPFYGVYSFYVAEDGNGLYEVYGYMGVEEVRRLTLQGNQAEEELLWSREIGDGEYYENDNPIEYAQGSDLSLLDE